MDIRFGNTKDIKGLKELWHLVFEDSYDYIDFFFDRCYPNCRSVVATVENRVVAMLFLLPSTVVFDDNRYKAAYIYAVATHPDFRSKGISRQLLEFTHENLSLEDYALCYLRPASQSLFDFYSRYNFVDQFGVDEKIFNREDVLEDINISDEIEETTLVEMSELADKLKSNLSVYISWEKPMLSYIDLELTKAKGKVYKLKNGNAYGVCYKSADGYLVKELLATDKSAQTALLSGINKKLDGVLAYRMVGDKPFGMAYWYKNAPKAKIRNCYVGLVLD